MSGRRIRQRPEQAAQIAVVRFLRMALPRDAVFWHTPNGGKRTKVEAGLFKALGVLPGFPDLAILYHSRLYVAEIKAPGHGTSDAQADCFQRLTDAGAADMGVWESMEDCEASLRSWGIPLRATIFSATKGSADAVAA